MVIFSSNTASTDFQSYQGSIFTGLLQVFIVPVCPFQSYQGSIFTSDVFRLPLMILLSILSRFNFYNKDRIINPISVSLSILSRFNFYTVYVPAFEKSNTAFNPIKVQFLQKYMLLCLGSDHLSILSRFNFYDVLNGAIRNHLVFQSYQGSIFTLLRMR